MIIGVGCDIIEIERVAKACQRASFVGRVFAAEEIDYCNGRGKQSAASFAARFAAKEAVLKAFGTGWRGGALNEIVIVNDDLGKPAVRLYGYHKEQAEKLGVTGIKISLSHARDVAMAYVVMEDAK